MSRNRFAFSNVDFVENEGTTAIDLKPEYYHPTASLKGVMTITSEAGRFTAVAEGSDLEEVNDRLKSQIRHRLQKWKVRHLRRRPTPAT
jgi:hypothetical protein